MRVVCPTMTRYFLFRIGIGIILILQNTSLDMRRASVLGGICGLQRLVGSLAVCNSLGRAGMHRKQTEDMLNNREMNSLLMRHTPNIDSAYIYIAISNRGTRLWSRYHAHFIQHLQSMHRQHKNKPTAKEAECQFTEFTPLASPVGAVLPTTYSSRSSARPCQCASDIVLQRMGRWACSPKYLVSVARL